MLSVRKAQYIGWAMHATYIVTQVVMRYTATPVPIDRIVVAPPGINVEFIRICRLAIRGHFDETDHLQPQAIIHRMYSMPD
jgi:hypothetical protein